jgi:RNA polymerase sigma factor (sigma-70 family)
VAFNVDGALPPESDNSAPHRGIRSYSDRWPQDTPWTVVWDSLTKPLAQEKEGGASSLLGELAWSVACEHRDDWQHSGARSIDVVEANRAFEVVYLRNKAKILGDVYRSFGQRAGSPDAIVDEAWSRVFCDYWSLTARRRFLGLSRISTLVCQVARYVAMDAIRDRGPSATQEKTTLDGDSPRGSPSLEDLGISDDPAAHLVAAELESKIKACMSRLPARQRIVAEMVWFREIRAKRVAEILRVSEPAVSQHLKKAREAIGRCLKGNLPGGTPNPTA